MARGRLTLGVLAALSACVEPVELDQDGGLAQRSQAVIYGDDDRRDVFAHPDSRLRAIAQSSTLALVPRRRIVRAASGEYGIPQYSLQSALAVCSDARFAAQPVVADCSGVLIDDDLVLTAAHCFASQEACGRYAFVFDFYYRAEGELEPVSFGDVYGCRRVIDRSLSARSPRLDYAVVQLDRPALGRTPVTVRRAPLLDGEPLATIGSVSGLPFKIDTGSHVLSTRAPRGDFFLLDSDTFAGSSGSGVFDAAGQLVGVLVRGGEDYQERADASCVDPKRVAVPTDGGAPLGGGEEATYVARVIEGLCSRGWPSARLCGVQPRCGDGLCTGSETRSACPIDCECRDGQCAPALTGPAQLGKALDEGTRDGCSTLPGRPGRAGLAMLAVLALAGLARWRSARRRRST